jgi:hypothetical protein
VSRGRPVVPERGSKSAENLHEDIPDDIRGGRYARGRLGACKRSENEGGPARAAKAREDFGRRGDEYRSNKDPKGRIVSAEIEEESGKLIFSFDIRTDGKTGIDEVNVALTGRVLDVQHESPKDETQEKAKDQAEKSNKR